MATTDTGYYLENAAPQETKRGLSPLAFPIIGLVGCVIFTILVIVALALIPVWINIADNDDTTTIATTASTASTSSTTTTTTTTTTVAVALVTSTATSTATMLNVMGMPIARMFSNIGRQSSTVACNQDLGSAIADVQAAALVEVQNNMLFTDVFTVPNCVGNNVSVNIDSTFTAVSTTVEIQSTDLSATFIAVASSAAVILSNSASVVVNVATIFNANSEFLFSQVTVITAANGLTATSTAANCPANASSGVSSNASSSCQTASVTPGFTGGGLLNLTNVAVVVSLTQTTLAGGATIGSTTSTAAAGTMG